jgi:hypothetical protein
MTTSSPMSPPPTPQGTVYALIAAWALRARQRQLIDWALGGAVAAIGIVIVKPAWWLAAMPFVCVASVGTWGVVSQRIRLLHTTPGSERRWHLVLRLIAAASVVLGTAAAIVAMYGALWLILNGRLGAQGG